MTVQELEDFLKDVKEKEKSVYFYMSDDHPFDEGMGVENAFEVSNDLSNTGNYEGVYLKVN